MFHTLSSVIPALLSIGFASRIGSLTVETIQSTSLIEMGSSRSKRVYVRRQQASGRSWAIGLAIVVALLVTWLLSIEFFSEQGVEEHVRTTVSRDLAAAGFEDIIVRGRGQSLELIGVVAQPADVARIATIASLAKCDALALGPWAVQAECVEDVDLSGIDIRARPASENNAPNTLVIARDASGYSVSGLLATTALHRRVIQILSASGAKVRDSVLVWNSMPPPNFSEEAKQIADLASRLAEGTVELSSERLRVRGLARFKELPKVRKIEKYLITRTKDTDIRIFSYERVKRCDRQLAAALKKKSVYFTPGDVTVTEKNAGLLDELVGIVRECDMVVQIEGHTDSLGEAEENMRISKQRADALRLALVRHGADEDLLEVVPMGATRPIADNRTFEGRARNRRLEMRVRR